jgi:Zn finger protein HypA/HybF involved in hydrogenase expression
MSITDPLTPTNIKPREVWCPQCKVTITTDVATPTCQECFGATMITVLYSVVTGHRITGVERTILATPFFVNKE